MKRLYLLAVALVVAGLSSGAASAAKKYEAPPFVGACGDSSYEDAKSKGVTLGISPSPPYSSIDPASNVASGIDVEIHQAVLDTCDADDGVKDGVLEDPTRCRFDPGVLTCKGADAPACLTAPQVEAARKIYAPAVNPRTGRQIFPGHQPGSELGWATMAGPQPFAIGLDFFRYVVFENPNWDPRTFNFDADYASAERAANGTINALDPDLKRFFGHGGKIVQYHGWSDPQISPGSSVEYYGSVVAAVVRSSLHSAYAFVLPLLPASVGPSPWK